MGQITALRPISRTDGSTVNQAASESEAYRLRRIAQKIAFVIFTTWPIMYSHYKPLRNHLSKQHLFPGLDSVWRHMTRVGDSGDHVRLREPDKYQFDWELELLAREIVLNCGGSVVPLNGDVASFDLTRAVNHIRRIDEAISKEKIDSPEAALSSIHTLIHQQAPWQDDDLFYRVTRYAKIMQHGPLAKIVEPALGISISDLYKIGLAVGGALCRDPKILSSNYTQTPGISPGADQAFFKLVSTDIETLRCEIRNVQNYDQRWAFTYNPLRGKPLVYDANTPEKLLGISEKLLLWRITAVVYFTRTPQ